MPELTESQKKQYEEVREWLSIKVMEFATQMVSENYKSSYQFSTEILSDPRIAILDEDQDMRISITSSGPPVQADDIFKIQKDFSDFKRVLPKGEVKP